MRKYTLCLLFLFAGVLFSGCSKEDDVPGVDEVEKIERTILMYVIADTNIADYLKNGIFYFYQSLTPEVLKDNRLVIYWDGPALGGRSKFPELYEVRFDKAGELVEKPIITYTEQVNSADAKVFKKILEEVIKRFPSEDYGLIMSSHATGWLPDKIEYARSIGSDNGDHMEIPDLAWAIPDNTFNFILFDACHMACAEVVYELRNKTEYILASPAETLAEGYPYQKMGADLFKPRVDWKKVIDIYYDHYMAKGSPVERTVSQSIIKTEKMDELALFCKSVLQGEWEEILSNPAYRQGAQSFDYFDKGYHFVYDQGEFIERKNPAAYNEFIELMEQIVPYYRHSDWILQGMSSGFEVKRYCGLGTYVPTPAHTAMNAYYQTLSWYETVY